MIGENLLRVCSGTDLSAWKQQLNLEELKKS